MVKTKLSVHNLGFVLFKDENTNEYLNLSLEENVSLDKEGYRDDGVAERHDCTADGVYLLDDNNCRC